MFDFLGRLYAYFHSEDLILVGISIIVGLVIVVEREYQNKSAGLRTLMLVSVGSCLFTILSVRIGVGSPDRIAANIITGIGFLGAGVIFKDENKVSGLTTACTIWITAALGMAVGSSHIFLALFGSAVVLVVLWLLVALQNFIDRRHRVENYKICVADPEKNLEIEKAFRGSGLSTGVSFKSKTAAGSQFVWHVRGRRSHHEAAIKQLLANPDILEISI